MFVISNCNCPLRYLILVFILMVLWIYWYLLDKNQGTIYPQLLLQVTERPQRCPERQDLLRQIMPVNTTKTLLLSAYQEHRSGKKEVRVIALVLRSETVAYRCLFCCQKRLHVSKGVSYIQNSHFGFAYGTSHIMCPVPSGCETPSQITVTAAADSDEGELDDFLEVKNQVGKTDSFPYDFTVCFSVMYEYKNVLQLVQSMELLQLLGVNKVIIYQTSNSPEVQRILDYYTNKGLLEVINWSLSRFLNVSRRWLPEHGPGDLHYFGQIPALNDCVYRYMHQSKYVALHDLDELFLPQTVDSWSELLPLLEKKYSPNQCFMFENNVFPYTITLPPPGSQALPLQSSWQNVTGVNILAHLYQEPVRKGFTNFKIIVNPRAVISPTVHGLVQSQTGCSWVDRNVARMYHTRAPSPDVTPDQLIYDGRLLKYSSSVSLGVNTVLKESGLLPENSHQ